MSSQTVQIDNELINSLREKRSELIKLRSSLSTSIKDLNDQIARAVEKRPARSTNSSKVIESQIEERESQIEMGGIDVAKEKKMKQEIYKLNASLRKVKEQEDYEDQIREMRDSRAELFKQSDEMNKTINELDDTIFVGESLLRIKEVTGEMMDSKDLKKKEITIPKERIGPIVGKKMANLHSYEEEYGVAIHMREDSLILSGKESNILRCENMIVDMVEQSELTMTVEQPIITTLINNKNKYRMMISEENHVFMNLDATKRTIVIRGGKQAVQRAEKAIMTIAKKTVTVQITPFIRSCLVNDAMADMKKLREACDAHLSLNEHGTEITIYGIGKDVQTGKKVLENYIANHVEATEELKLTNDFYFHTMDNKGQILKDATRLFSARIELLRGQNTLKITATADNIEKCKAYFAEEEEKFKSTMIVFDVSEAQMSVLISDKAAMVNDLQKKNSCRITCNKDELKVYLMADEDKREAAKAAIQAALDNIQVETRTIPSSMIPEFVGEKGSNIKSIRGNNKVSIDIIDNTVRLSGAKEEMKDVMERMNAWLATHYYEEMDGDMAVVREVILGRGGNTKQQLMKQLGVNINVEKSGQVQVIGEEEKCKPAIEKLKEMVEKYKRENRMVEVSELITNNAREFRRDLMEAKMKEFGVNEVKRREGYALNGKEDKLDEAEAYLNSLKEKYKDYVSEPVDVKTENIGVLIGKKGDNLRKLEEELNVQFTTPNDKKVYVWCNKADLEKVKEGIKANMRERVIVTKELKATVKQIRNLTEHRNELLFQIQDETNANIRVPRDMPAMGPATVTIRGNENEVSAAMQLVKEALQGLIRMKFIVAPDVLKGALYKTSLQIERLRLESNCKIECNEEKGNVVIVGERKGVLLVRMRLFTHFAEVDGKRYHVEELPMDLSYSGSELKDEVMKVIGDNTMVDTDKKHLYLWNEESVEEDIVKAKEIISQMAKENVVIEVDQDIIPVIIGQKGARIKEIRKNSGAEIDIEDDRYVHAYGKEDAAAKAKDEIESIVSDYRSTHVTINVDPNYMYSVSNFSTIAPIQRDFDVRISIRREENRVFINGANAENVQYAKDAVQNIIDGAKARDEEGMGNVTPNSNSTSSNRQRRERDRERESNNSGVSSATAPVEATSVWEQLKKNTMYPPGMSKKAAKKEDKKDELNRLLGLRGVSENTGDYYQSESGYTVMF